MPRRLINPRVRRRLFEPDEPADQAKMENFTNAILESIERDRIEMTQKYNFDFINETPLDGNFEWYKNINDNTEFDWIGIKAENVEGKKKSCLSMRFQNETTPKSRSNESLPTLRKRRSDVDVMPETTVRRRISFD